MYIYSIFALGLTVYLTPYIKTESPLHCLALAWFYVLDSIVNAAYTGVFGVTWFLVLMSHQAGTPVGNSTGPGAGTVGDTAGFTDPEFNVSKVDVVAAPQGVALGSGQDAVAGGTPADVPAGTNANIVWGRESINSLGIIILLWTIRAYFCLVMLAWARMVLRQHIAAMNARDPNTNFAAASKDTGMAENPFADGKPDGNGWTGKLGRFMVGIGKGYWLGVEGDETWMNGISGKFGQQARRQGAMGSISSTTSSNGGAIQLAKINSERESRRRSGTGPPLPSVAAAAGVISDGEDGGESGKLLQVPQQ